MIGAVVREKATWFYSQCTVFLLSCFVCLWFPYPIVPIRPYLHALWFYHLQDFSRTQPSQITRVSCIFFHTVKLQDMYHVSMYEDNDKRSMQLVQEHAPWWGLVLQCWVWVLLNFIVCNINVLPSMVHETFQSNSNDLSDGLCFTPSTQNKSTRQRSWLYVHLPASLSTTLNLFWPNSMLVSTPDIARHQFCSLRTSKILTLCET